MAVPKAPPNVDHCLATEEHNIRPARQIPALQPITIPLPVQQPADDQLRFGVRASDGGHVPAALRRNISEIGTEGPGHGGTGV